MDGAIVRQLFSTTLSVCLSRFFPLFSQQNTCQADGIYAPKSLQGIRPMNDF
jgi:hypothetical protein